MKNLNTEHQISKANSFKCMEKQFITAEKRKRSQKYSVLNYCAEFITYFDFLSLDAFNIIKNSKYLAQSSSSNVITNSHVLLSFLEKNNEFHLILEEFGITRTDVIRALTSQQSSYFSFIEQALLKLKLFFLKKNAHNLNSLTFSEETSILLEKAAENALLYFKTPVITSEILFLTLVEQENTSISEYLKKTSSKKVLWYSFRYKLLKRVHLIESYIRNHIPKNQQYFAYLLQTQLPESHFDRLINNDIVGLGVLFFRTKLFSKTHKFSVSSILEKEIYNSIKFCDHRKYSS